MSPSSFSQYQENVKRQSREQKLFGTFLNFFGYVLLAAILLVAGLAAYGGYTLSRQIQQQSLTISEMETRFNAQVASLSDALKQARDATDALEGVTQAQKQQITWLSAQLTEVRAQSKKDRDALQSRLQRVESRLFDIERKTSSSIWSR
ncbi:MAG: hypothetical protein IT578_08425 [Verrucomicrobiae bacterium]|nr:hypothetical protein [Verrucomicrobiae bacterium]